MPTACTNSGEQNEFTVMHTGQTGRDGNEVTDYWNETTGKCGCYAVVVEVFLAFLKLLLVKKAHLTPLAVGKLIDNRAANIVGSECGKQYYKEYV